MYSIVVNLLMLSIGRALIIDRGSGNPAMQLLQTTSPSASSSTPMTTTTAPSEPQPEHDSGSPHGFVTGHRIPLELFRKETLRRIEAEEDATPETEPQVKKAPISRYVDSASFRKDSAAAAVMQGDLGDSDVFQHSLSREVDRPYLDAITRFVPDDY